MIKNLLLFLLPGCFLLAQPAERVLVEKNFYLITALDNFPELKAALPAGTKTGNTVSGYLFSDAEIIGLDSLLSLVYDRNRPAVDKLLDQYIRPSGSYSLFDSLANKQLWLKCWHLYYRGINYIVDVYGLGHKYRYPDIDSASYEVKSAKYQGMLDSLFSKLKPELSATHAFYENPMQVALALLRLNRRNEAARFEPLESGENEAAKEQVGKTDFSAYSYSALVIPGEGPEVYGQPLSEGGVKRCELAAQAYRSKKAPFIILSGGYCHPFQTPYCEAIEMKKYLIANFDVPASAIIIDPHARHTTTNFRNAGRYLIRYGFPLDKPVLAVTVKDQADYIIDPRFDDRNRKELGYLPYKELKRVSDEAIEFYTVKEVMFRDPIDPLDP